MRHPWQDFHGPDELDDLEDLVDHYEARETKPPRRASDADRKLIAGAFEEAYGPHRADQVDHAF